MLSVIHRGNSGELTMVLLSGK